MKLSTFSIGGWLGVLACLISTPAMADWKEFRGPTGQGHADHADIPLNWDETKNVVWKQSVPGIAWSSPVIANDRVYMTTAVKVPSKKKDAQQIVHLGAICLSADDGKILWQKTLFEQKGKVEIHKKNSHASPTPIIDGDALYLHYGPHGTARLKLNGDVVWKEKLPYSPTHGNGGSPALAGDLLIICCDGHDVQYVTGIEKKTGKARWKVDRGLNPKRGFSFSTPLIIEVNGQSQAICPGSDAVLALEPATGKEIWRVLYPGGYSVVPRPVYGEGLVFVCSGYNRPTLYAIDPTGHGDVTETHVKWTTDKQVPHSASPVLVGENLFFVSDKGIARCVNAKTGKSNWQKRLGGNFSASPLAVDDHLYFQDEDGTATVVAASSTFKELAKNQLPEDERTYASYAVSDNALFIRSEKELFRIEKQR